MCGLSFCDGRRDGRPDDQFAASIAKMPLDALSASEMFPATSIEHSRIAPGRDALRNWSKMGQHDVKFHRLVESHLQIGSCTRRSSRMAYCTLCGGHSLTYDKGKGMNLLGQYFQPCSWTRCFNSEEPSHECSGPPGMISC